MLCIVNLAKDPLFVEFIGPMDKPTSIILLNRHSIKLLSPYLYSHRLLQLSDLITEVSLCRAQQKLSTENIRL